MRNVMIGLVMCGALLLTGCAKSGSTDAGQTATVMLKDGGSFTGTVTKSDTSAITLTASNGESRTYPMSQVDSVRYGDTTAPADSVLNAATKPTPYGSAPSDSVSSTASLPATPAPAAPRVEPVRKIPAGTRLEVRNSDRIQAGVAEVGEKFPGVIVQDVIGADGGVAIPRGSDAMLIVRSSQGQGKIEGRSEIALDLDSVTVGGRHYNLETVDIVQQGTQGLGKNKRSGEFVGGGAVLGTIIGAVAGGGKGAAIGAAAGAGAGVGAQALTRGKAITIPSESVLSFRLEAPVSIRLVR